MKASCQAILAGAGRSSGLAVRLHWRESSKPGGGGGGGTPKPNQLQVVQGWAGPTLVKKGAGSNSGAGAPTREGLGGPNPCQKGDRLRVGGVPNSRV